MRELDARAPPTPRPSDLVPRMLEVHPAEHQHVGLVVDDQDLRHAGTSFHGAYVAPTTVSASRLEDLRPGGRRHGVGARSTCSAGVRALTSRGRHPTLGDRAEGLPEAGVRDARHDRAGAPRRRATQLVSARQIAERAADPAPLPRTAARRAAQGRLVESFRGAGGGCRLARTAEDITVADIAEAIEGQVFPMGCLEPTDHTCFADSPVRPPGVLGRRRAGDRRGVPHDDAWPIWLARQQELGPPADRSGDAAVPAQLSRDPAPQQRSGPGYCAGRARRRA